MVDKVFVETGWPVFANVEYLTWSKANSFVFASTSAKALSIGEISEVWMRTISDLRSTVGKVSSVVK